MAPRKRAKKETEVQRMCKVDMMKYNVKRLLRQEEKMKRCIKNHKI